MKMHLLQDTLGYAIGPGAPHCLVKHLVSVVVRNHSFPPGGSRLEALVRTRQQIRHNRKELAHIPYTSSHECPRGGWHITV